jgi:hypothetical protein
MRDAWLEEKIAMTKKLGLTALAGVAAIVIGFSLKAEYLSTRQSLLVL